MLTGKPISSMEDMEDAARALLESGAGAVFLKGGHFGDGEITDILLTPEGIHEYTHAAFPGRFHGTGCALSSAVAAGLARGRPLADAVGGAVDYVQHCLQNSVAPIKGRLGLLGHGPRS